MIGENVKRGRKEETDRDTIEESGENHNISSSRLRIVKVESLISVYRHGEKEGCANDVCVDVDWIGVTAGSLEFGK